MEPDKDPESANWKTPSRTLAAWYEDLRSRQPDSRPDATWIAVTQEMDRRCREDGGLKTAQWTYTWDHGDDVMRRLPSYKSSAGTTGTKYMPRILRMPDRFRDRNPWQNHREMAG